MVIQGTMSYPYTLGRPLEEPAPTDSGTIVGVRVEGVDWDAQVHQLLRDDEVVRIDASCIGVDLASRVSCDVTIDKGEVLF